MIIMRFAILIKKLVAVAAFALTLNSSIAAISVYPISLSMNAQGSGQIKVLSSSDKTEYVRVSVKAIDNPATDAEKERDLSAEENFFATPAIFALSAGNSRVVRMVNMVAPEKEKAYRVYFESVDSMDHEATAGAKPNQAQLGVNMKWGALVLVPPVSPRNALTYNYQENKLINNGNIHLRLTSIGICPSKENDNACIWRQVAHAIYPDQFYSIKDIVKNKLGNKVIKIKFISGIDKTTVTQVF
jgi:P pilus assembly chaperone PapD